MEDILSEAGRAKACHYANQLLLQGKCEPGWEPDVSQFDPSLEKLDVDVVYQLNAWQLQNLHRFREDWYQLMYGKLWQLAKVGMKEIHKLDDGLFALGTLKRPKGRNGAARLEVIRVLN